MKKTTQKQQTALALTRQQEKYPDASNREEDQKLIDDYISCRPELHYLHPGKYPNAKNSPSYTEAFRMQEAAKQFPSKVVKAALHHLDGTTSEVKMTYPNYFPDMQLCEIAAMELKETINRWTRFFIKISSYQISIGSIDVNGNEHYSISYNLTEIPADRIYYNGRWRTSEFMKKVYLKQDAYRAKKWN